MFDQYFDFKNREKDIYQMWEAKGVFKFENATNPQGEVFNITMPPPNANGEMHLGHSFGHTLMDIMGRYHRLKGDRVMLVPGKDHAGIQTQVVYERKLRAEGVDIENMSREDFWQSCYDFCIDRSAYMRSQEKELGTGADFEKEIFTLEPGVSEIVIDTFLKMYRDGLVYRGSRIVNWSVYSQTSISDVEVEYKEAKGHLWHIEYPFIERAVRPERRKVNAEEFKKFQVGKEIYLNEGNHWVMILKADGLTDEMLRVGEVVDRLSENNGIELERDYIVFRINRFPGNKTKDEQLEKYNDEIGRVVKQAEEEVVLVEMIPDLLNEKGIVVATTRPETMLGDTAIAVHPLDQRYTHLIGAEVEIPVSGRRIPVITDDRVDIAYGTGAVKITPAHDFLDYEIGKDHKLGEIQVIDKMGKMTAEAGEEFKGMTVEACRARLIELLTEREQLLLTEEITHKVPIAERGKDVIEPLISTQWFIDVDKEGLSLKKRAIELLDSGRLKVYPDRLKESIRQWLTNLNDWNVSRQILWGHRMPVWYQNKDTDREEIYVGKEAPEGEGWEQETDTFDTWFSSGQWPYTTLSSLGFLNVENLSGSQFFPTHTMLMGRDILFFWACRMLLFSAYRFNDIPWKNIYFTGLIRDDKGQKMSKSKGNGVEPREMLEKYGADALRAGLVFKSTEGLDSRFSEKKIETFAKFLNKIWNASKLVAMKGEGDYRLNVDNYPNLKLDSSKWILGRLNETQQYYRELMDKNKFHDALMVIYHFAWDFYCSIYLEVAKLELELKSEHTEEIKASMFKVLEGILQMIHPFMPFFSEQIHENMEKFGSDKLLAEKIFVEVADFDEKIYQTSQKEMQKLLDIVSAVREFRMNLGKGFKDSLVIRTNFEVSSELRELVIKMVNVEFAGVEADQEITMVKPMVSGNLALICSSEEKQLLKSNLEKNLEKAEKELTGLTRMLTPGFKEKADPELVSEKMDDFERLNREVNLLKEEIKHN